MLANLGGQVVCWAKRQVVSDQLPPQLVSPEPQLANCWLLTVCPERPAAPPPPPPPECGTFCGRQVATGLMGTSPTSLLPPPSLLHCGAWCPQTTGGRGQQADKDIMAGPAYQLQSRSTGNGI